MGGSEQLGLTGSKFGCDVGLCGACTMHIDGAPNRTCVMPIADLQGRKVTTIEGLSPNHDHPVQKAWIELDVPQCGYCQSGMIMAAASLLSQHPHPTDRDIDRTMTNLCRCANLCPHSRGDPSRRGNGRSHDRRRSIRRRRSVIASSG